MTLHTLENYYDMAFEIDQLNEHIETLRSKVESAQSPVLDGQPKSPRQFLREEMLLEAIELEYILAAKIVELMQERKAVETHIESIEDSMKRQIMRKRFIEGKRWADVADEVGYTEYHVRRLTKNMRDDLKINNDL